MTPDAGDSREGVTESKERVGNFIEEGDQVALVVKEVLRISSCDYRAEMSLR